MPCFIRTVWLIERSLKVTNGEAGAELRPDSCLSVLLAVFTNPLLRALGQAGVSKRWTVPLPWAPRPPWVVGLQVLGSQRKRWC